MPLRPRSILWTLLILVSLVGCRSEGGSAGGVKSLKQLQQEVADKEQAVANIVSAGQKAPEFSLKDLNGNSVSLASFAGKIVLLNFWATWCVPCVDEMPSLQRLHDKLSARGLVVVAVTVDDSESVDAVKKFVQDNRITMPVLLDPDGSLPAKLGVSGYPESVFIGPDGAFIAVTDSETGDPTVRFVGERAWDSKFLFEQIERVVKPIKASPTKG